MQSLPTNELKRVRSSSPWVRRSRIRLHSSCSIVEDRQCASNHSESQSRCVRETCRHMHLSAYSVFCVDCESTSRSRKTYMFDTGENNNTNNPGVTVHDTPYISAGPSFSQPEEDAPVFRLRGGATPSPTPIQTDESNMGVDAPMNFVSDDEALASPMSNTVIWPG